MFGDSSLGGSGGRDSFVAHYDASGNFRGVIEAGGVCDDRGLGIAVQDEQDCTITGYFCDTAIFGVSKLSTVTNVATGVAPINIFVAKLAMDSASPKLEASRLLGDATFAFNISGLRGQLYSIESSTNFQNWIDLVTITNQNPVSEFRDSSLPVAASRFYRAKLR